MKAAEESAFARGASADALMEAAGAALARHVQDFLPSPGHAIVACGKGNNAGDVLVAARHLAAQGWSFEVDLAFPEPELSPLSAQKLAELRASQSQIENRRNEPAGPGRSKSKIVLDGLLGIGATGAPREPVATAIRRINSLRVEHNAFVVAADIPSGLDADTGAPAEPCVVADLTVTVGHCKKGLVADTATNFVGRLALAELPDLAVSEGEPVDPASLLTPGLLQPLLPPRTFDTHKGTWGRVGIIAGSPGFVGAARLCAEAALRAGAGLVTLYATHDIYGLLASSLPPEIMVIPVRDYLVALNHRLDAVGIGPGLGSHHGAQVRELVTRMATPMVVDADALNHLARNPYAWQKMEGPRLFTPHPAEMARLFRESMDLSRREAAGQYVEKRPVTLLLKGARTLIAERKQPMLYNTTGNPGMGTGGMGDVLTGVCAAFIAAKRTPREAAMLGAWLCGRAAELAVFGPGGSPESLAASDVIRHLGAAIRDLRENF